MFHEVSVEDKEGSRFYFLSFLSSMCNITRASEIGLAHTCVSAGVGGQGFMRRINLFASIWES